jgi:hypothetical protein
MSNKSQKFIEGMVIALFAVMIGVALIALGKLALWIVSL